MHRVLRPVVTGEQTARLRVHVLAVQPDERPLARRQPDRVQSVGADTELVELADGVRLQIDADAERLELRDGFEHAARHADLLQRQRDTESADAATGNEHGEIGHGLLSRVRASSEPAAACRRLAALRRKRRSRASVCCAWKPRQRCADAVGASISTTNRLFGSRTIATDSVEFPAGSSSGWPPADTTSPPNRSNAAIAS